MQRAVVDVCLIENDAPQRVALLDLFVREGVSVVEAADGAEGLEQIRRHHPRVVVCGFHTRHLNGLEICQAIRADNSLDGTYVIILTACDTRETKHNVLNAGADDFLAKPPDEEELLARLRNGLRVSSLQERLRRAALTDGLTGLWNHTQFRHLLDLEFSRTRRYGGVVSLLMLDLDHFKAVNDTYGHETGNRVLQATARHLVASLRDIDIVARYGGEEFAVICPQTDALDAENLAERIRVEFPTAVRNPEHPQLRVTASVGVVASTHPNVVSVRDMINLADQALYVGKREGRNRVIRADQMADAANLSELQIDEVDRLRKQVIALSMQAKELCLQSVWSLVQALEARDRYTASHSRNVTFYTNRLIEAAGWPEALRNATANAAMLHDLGKIGVPDELLQKRQRLEENEAQLLRQVPLITCKILEPLRIFETETLIIRHLRERYDGTGYPHGLAGTHIPIGSRMLAVSEAFDAMTSARAYRANRTIDDAVAEIRSEAGNQFDPHFAELLETVVEEQREEWQTRIDRTLAEHQAATKP